MEDRLRTLDRLAAGLHAGHLDKQGVPYIAHLRAVTAAVSDQAKPVALFHDTLEDGCATRDTLARMLSPDELAAVVILTRDKEAESYSDFIGRILAAPGLAGELAREVKIADVRHNLSRMTADLERLRPRYEQALEQLVLVPATE